MRISDWSSDVCSSDLGGAVGKVRPLRFGAVPARARGEPRGLPEVQPPPCDPRPRAPARAVRCRQHPGDRRRARPGRRAQVQGPEEVRSEEHTSELQSLMRNSYAVFCLKKNKTQLLPKTKQTSKLIQHI